MTFQGDLAKKKEDISTDFQWELRGISMLTEGTYFQF